MVIHTSRERLAELCIKSGLTGLPRNQENRLVLLKSGALTLGPGARYTESEVDELLQSWLTHIGKSIQLDHVNLRRWRWMSVSSSGQGTVLSIGSGLTRQANSCSMLPLKSVTLTR